MSLHSVVPLTPVTFLERSGQVFPELNAIISKSGNVSFSNLLHRTRCLAQAIKMNGVEYGDRVVVLMDNCQHSIEAHFAIPAIGAIIVMLNPWLSEKDLVTLINDCKPSMILTDAEILNKCFAICPDNLISNPKFIIKQKNNCRHNRLKSNCTDYEECISNYDGSKPLNSIIKSEFDPIAINYTSGTTGKAKGVVYSHRAAYLHSLGQVLMLNFNKKNKYLWTLPMFHVNGWGHMWMAVAVAGTQVIFSSKKIKEENFEFVKYLKRFEISHLSGAPRLIRQLVEVPDHINSLQGITIVIGGTTPSSKLVQKLELLGIRIIHQYGLNETLGPYVVNEEKSNWKYLNTEERSLLRIRQGMATIHAGTGLRVVDKNCNDVVCDGESLGEVIMAGNTVATEYYNNIAASRRAFRNGWFFSGDMAVVHPDGCLEIRDRIKDLIYIETDYGWENISSIEIENILSNNIAINDVAVICIPMDKKNFVPVLVAYVELNNKINFNENDFFMFCDRNLSSYMRPTKVYFSSLPKTVTGKIQKNILMIDAIRRMEECFI